MRISSEVEQAFSLATREAARRRHEHVTLEHLLYALMFDSETADAVRHAGGDAATIKARLASYLDDQGKRLEGDVQPALSLGFQRVIGRAAMHVQTSGENDLRGPNVFVALFAERDSHAATLLEEVGVTRFDVVNYFSSGVSKIAPAEPAAPAAPIRGEPDKPSDDARAGSPEGWSLDSFPWTRAPGVSESRVRALGDLGFLTAAENIVFIGATGTGKTGLASALFDKATEKGHRGLFVRAQDMFDEVSASRAEATVQKLVRPFAEADLLVIDELGYFELDQRQAHFFFRLIDARYRRGGTLVTTHLDYEEWHGFIGHKALCAALLGRLLHRCHTVALDGPSLREARD